MYDIAWIRDHSEAFDHGLARRGLAPMSARALELDQARRALITETQDLQTRRNALSREVGEAMKAGERERAETLKAEVANIKARMTELEDEETAAIAALNQFLSFIPNLPAADVPDGADETANTELRRVGEPPRANQARDHVALGEGLKLLDFERAVRLSGSRFSILSGDLARLERALAQFMLDLHTTEHGYTEVSAPLLVRDEAVFGVGQLPKFAEDLFRTTNGLWLISTSEASLSNLRAQEIVPIEELPLRFTAHTPCFRSEAGAAGKDTRGMIRQHQFWKVELVSLVAPEESWNEHDRMTQCAEEVLKRLGLPFRTMVLSTGDMGFCAAKTHDIEVWLPGQNCYREISSCSNTLDFQARRMNARLRRGGEGKPEYLHTLNGSGVAVGRALIAVLENYQQPDGSIAIPDVLKPYMAGREKIDAAT